MQYQSMREDPEIVQEADHRKLKRLTDRPCRWVQQAKKLKELPSKYLDFRQHEHIQIDVSYNKTLDVTTTFDQLLDLKDGLKGLAFSKNQASEFPSQLFELLHLEELEWRSNGLKSIPAELSALSNLKHVNLRHNSLRVFPETLLQFKGLKSLVLRFNKIKELPERIGELTALEHLDVSGCGLKKLPAAIGQLRQLKVLEVEDNQLTDLPSELVHLTQLQRLAIKGNKDLDLASYMKLLAKQKATVLDLGDFKLFQLPENIGVVTTLEEIRLTGNKLTQLPASFKQLKNLKRVNITDFEGWDFGNFVETMSVLPGITELSLRGEVEDAPEIATAIGKWKHLRKVRINAYRGLDKIPNFLAHARNVTSLVISNTTATEIPDFVSQLPLEELVIGSNPHLVVPQWIFEMRSVKKLQIAGNHHDSDLQQLKQMDWLEELSSRSMDNEMWSTAGTLPNLRRLSADLLAVDELYGSTWTNTGLIEIELRNGGSHGIDNIVEFLAKLKSLRKVALDYTVPMNAHHLKTLLQQHPELEELQCSVRRELVSEDLRSLAQLKRGRFDFVSDYGADKVALSIHHSVADLDMERFAFSRVHRRFAEALEVSERIRQWQVPDADRRKFLFDILMGHFEALHQQLPNALKDGLKDGKVFVLGRPSFLKKPEIQSRLKSANAALVNKPEKANSVLLCPSYDPDILQGLAQRHDLIWILEDHLREQVIEEDEPFLMQEENSELNDQIKRLLVSRDPDNMSLLLSMLEGGGINRVTGSYVLAILHHHQDKDVRKQARTVFRKYCSSALQDHNKNKWKASYAGKNLDKFYQVIHHSEIDFMAYVLAFSHVYAHNLSSGSGQAIADSLGKNWLHLRVMTSELLTDSAKDFDFISKLTIEYRGDISGEALYQLLKNNPLEYISISADLSTYPVELLQLPDLQSLEVNRNHGQRITLDMAEVTPNPSVKGLRFRNVAFRGDTDFFRGFTALERFACYQSDIQQLSFLSHLKGLKEVILNECSLTAFPQEVRLLKSLQQLDLSHNSITNIDFDFSQLPSLRSFSVINSGLRSISDTFSKNQELDSIDLRDNELQTLPESLFYKRDGAYSGININASKNKITAIAPGPKSRPMFGFIKKATRPLGKVNRLYLEDNLLDHVPKILFGLEKAHEVHLATNQIKELPSNIGMINTERIYLEVDKAVIPLVLFSGGRLRGISITTDDATYPSPELIPPHRVHMFWLNPKKDVSLREPYQSFMEIVRNQYIQEAQEY